MGLDFSKLENIAYRGFEGAEARAHKDAINAQGYTVIDDAASKNKVQSAPGQAETRRTLQPFMSTDGRNYRAIYRAVCEYHERNNPPRLAKEYWEKAADDISATAIRFNNDPFVFAMLSAVYEELGREYKTLEALTNGASAATTH